MNFEIRGIHYEVSDKTREQIEKKFKRLATAEDTLRPQTGISMTPSTS